MRISVLCALCLMLMFFIFPMTALSSDSDEESTQNDAISLVFIGPLAITHFGTSQNDLPSQDGQRDEKSTNELLKEEGDD